MGKLRKRMSFSRIDEVLEMPNLIEVQKNSYQRFLDTDLREVLNDVSPITDYNGNLVLEFVDYSLDPPKNSVARCRERDITYAAPLKVFVRLKNKETGVIHCGGCDMGAVKALQGNIDTDKGIDHQKDQRHVHQKSGFFSYAFRDRHTLSLLRSVQVTDQLLSIYIVTRKYRIPYFGQRFL